MAIERTVATYDEIFEFLTSQPTLEQIIAFRPSVALQERMEFLLEANRNNTLTTAESRELDDSLHLEHFLRMLKATARRKLAQS